MKTSFMAMLIAILPLTGCDSIKLGSPQEKTVSAELPLISKGYWITEPDGEVMNDPQTSGLVLWRGQLVTLSDRSAHESQRLRLRKVDQLNAKLQSDDMPIRLSDRVKTSCFGTYLGDNPDLEALTVDPDDDSVFLVVTEDASGNKPLSEVCRQQYGNSGATEYPTLLLRLKLQTDNSVLMTDVRPLQYSASMQVGNYPNDGIEALAFGKNRMLYLGLEKDAKGQARVFSLNITDDFWQTEEFAQVQDPQLKLPYFETGRHPINGMDYYPTDGQGYLIAAARNDEKLWIIDLSGKKDTVIVSVDFLAEIKPKDPSCGEWEKMDNASIEGVAVTGRTLWLVNDPWKKVYLNNIQCLQNKGHFEKMAPLLFSMPIDPRWFAD